MKFLADENIDRAMVQWLRSMGHDVVWAAEESPETQDSELLRMADSDGRIFITNDLDFGEIVYREGLVAHGILLLRLRQAGQEDRLQLIQAHWPQIEARLAGNFVVMSDRKLRVRPLVR